MAAVPFFLFLSSTPDCCWGIANMAKNIRDEIVAKRQARVLAMGFAEGVELPARREAPIVPFLGRNGLICEVKRKSPSKGDIAPGLDAVAQAGLYVKAGAGNLSVLTERDGFGGSLEDLVRVKRAYPEAAVLRKDFLFDLHDIDVAWRAGADAVLLIAGMLDAERLNTLYRCAKGLGMEALVEVHDAEDLEKAATFMPNLVGINSRDLTTFRIDPLLPLRVRSGIGWEARVVYESGIAARDQADFAVASGFDGLLVGEGVVREPALAGELLAALAGTKRRRFWPEIGKKLFARPGKAMVKVCGLTNADDVRLAAEMGADALGFVLYEKSPRCAAVEVLEAVRKVDVLKVGVVVGGRGEGLRGDVRRLLDEGLLDGVQLHGDEGVEDVAAAGPASYKVLRPRGVDDIGMADGYRCPRLLLDAAGDVPGGTGKRVGAEILESWHRPLWLAGGITPDNVGRIVEARRPELVDLASGVEESPGRKSPALLKKLFAELKNVQG